MAKLVLTMLQGLPGSGKTDLAKRIAKASGAVIVEKDEIRRVLKTQGWVWSNKNEDEVLKIRDGQIRQALEQGVSVVSADCNFGKHPARLEAIAKEYKAEFLKMVVPTPVDECIRRDSLRPDDTKVGAKVIQDMYDRYLKPKGEMGWKPPEMVKVREDLGGKELKENLMPAVIVDLDGTACLHNGRSPYDTAQCYKDLPNPMVREVVTLLARSKFYQVIYCSGRDDAFHEMSLTWLEKNNFPQGPLFMRKTGDKRNDAIVKTEIYNNRIKEFYDVRLCIDDRERVVKAWRGLGLICWQVADGAF